MQLHVHAALGHLDAFGFEKFSLQGSVGFSDEEFPTGTKDAMPGNCFAGGTSGHGATSGSGATRQAQGFSDGPIR